MEYEELIQARFSARKFKPIPVNQEDLDKILAAGRLAPTSVNYQPQKIYVLKSESAMQKLDFYTGCRFGSKTALLVCGDKNIASSAGSFSSAYIDATIVATHMMLEATNIGVDNIMLGISDSHILRMIFNLPENIEPVVFINLGYKTDECKPAHLHYKRKDLSETVEYI